MTKIQFKKLNLAECSSTNDEAKKWIKELKHAEGLVIYTSKQSDGKGMGSNKWFSENNKNLTCSVVLSPNLPIKNAFILNCFTSLAVVKILQDFGIQNIKIKWPNDILVNNKKIAGILIENINFKNNIKHSIIGIGLNINQINFNNNILQRKATSILLETKIENSNEEILNQFLNNLVELFYTSKINPIDIFQKYIQQLYLMDNVSWFNVNNEKIQLTIRGIGNDGALVTDDKEGNRRKFYSKEIQFLT
jgi:BirA family biotin operon repressor/biotin-[acetyl-CoA-carboxylase] ligase